MVILTLIFYFTCVFGFSTGTVPNKTNIPIPINVDEATITETLLDVFKVIDDDGDNITSCTHTGDNGEFDTQQNSTALEYFEVYLLSSTSLNYDSTPSYTLNVTCTDSAGETATETILIDVVENQAPIVVAPIRPVLVNEKETNQRLIYTVNVTDPEGDTVACNISGALPSTTAFDIWKEASDFEVYLLNNSILDYNVAATYVIATVCSDNFFGKCDCQRDCSIHGSKYNWNSGSY